jgi:hypothetical protein
MSWHTIEKNPSFYRIAKEDGEIIGSITLQEAGRWAVEISFDPLPFFKADVVGDFSEHTAALAFVEGVEKTIAAVQKP